MVISFFALFLPPSCLNPFRSVVNSLVSPPAVGVNRIFHYFSGSNIPASSVDSAQMPRLLARLRQLETQNAYLHSQWMRTADALARSERLRKNILLTEYSLIPANVCGYGQPGRASITIDQGSAAGLKVGFWVVAVLDTDPQLSGRALLESSVLVGQIASLQARTAQVRLLGDSDQPSMLAQIYIHSPLAQLEPSAMGPIMHINPSAGGRFIAKDIPNEDLGPKGKPQDVLEAAVVSYAVQNLPGGLAIGRVNKVQPSPRNMLFSDLTIEPYARTSRLSAVMILRPVNPPD